MSNYTAIQIYRASPSSEQMVIQASAKHGSTEQGRVFFLHQFRRVGSQLHEVPLLDVQSEFRF